MTMAIYALGDLHGHLDMLHEIQKILNDNDTVYFLGDAGDRGPEPWETIKAVLDDKRFVYLMGNHEQMLLEAYIDSKKYGHTDHVTGTQLYKNGGALTLEQALADPEGDKYIHMIRNLPYQKVFQNESGILVWLSHAGFTPNSYSIPTKDDLLWDRSHFYESWSEEDFPGCIVVHGHTPLPFLWQYLNTPSEDQEYGAFWYCDNHKICIDTGAYATNIAVLLNLNTFDEEIFQLEE